MSVGNGAGVSLAGGVAAVIGEVVVHPMDTVITRMQSSVYRSQYKNLDGSLKRALFSGLYQGFGPTLIASVPSSAAFFVAYEASRSAFARARAAGHVSGVPQPVLDAASSAGAELVACAIANPAEVLKQNAQVVPQARQASSPTAEILRRFCRRPSRLWAGYSALVASQLPSICLTFSLYETFKAALLERLRWQADDVARQMAASALSAALAGGCSSWLFVPIDVVKTRMRLAAGGELQAARPLLKKTSRGLAASSPPPMSKGAWAVAADVLRTEGVPGLFRGSILTCVAAFVGTGLYIGCYEGGKILFNELCRGQAPHGLSSRR
ncbi:mitochondrial carrier protein [Hirsutella rhossiliensis]|uniref:Mitochondrial carrier protein n=1 Tax=Hirsutella rhossiliensis TaxID=111463 RepID=A0A9P8N839_9HYPO|nr:mitochondrial carrier protein [Hirsutella rhossiliensis]KAH0968575.1 mitochondrial carrier protein [Hirsutella rhossiliensis]